MKHNHYRAKNTEQGLVSIIVVMVLMGVLVLISTSFALLIRREQRQALDRQLSTQAFYAAESGVNDAVDQLPGIAGDVTDCKTGGISGKAPINSNDNVDHTCVLIDQSPNELIYNPISTDSSQVVRLETSDGTPIDYIDISWQRDKSDNNDQFVSNSNTTHLLPQNGVNDPKTDNFTQNNGTGMIQVGVMPLTALNHNSLTQAARSYFLYPVAGPSNVSPLSSRDASSSQDAQFIDGNCNKSNNPGYKANHLYNCNAEIKFSSPSNVVYLRLKSIYLPTAANIRIYSGGVRKDIVGAQAVIDSTGKAQDVLRRIQVRVPLKGSYSYPEYSVDTGDSICKRMAFAQPGTDVMVGLPIPDTTPNNHGTVYYNRDNINGTNSSDADINVCNPTSQ